MTAGMVSYTVIMRPGQTGCEGTEWESETSVRCHAGHGSGGTRRVAMTAGERSGSMSESWSVAQGSVSVSGRSNRGGTGSASVTVHGASLGLVGYTGMVQTGQTGCEGTEWESETSVRCSVSRGSRGTRRVAMTAGERLGSTSAGFSVDAKGAVSAITAVLNRASTGSASLTVHGMGLGSREYTTLANSLGPACEATEWESDTSVRCLHQASFRGTKKVAITIGERVGTGTEMYMLSIDTGVMSGSRKTNRAGTGSSSMTVHGAGFGWVTWYSSQARYTQTGCEGTEWESETSMRCLVGQGAQGSRRLTITAGKLMRSMTDAYSVDDGQISVTGRHNQAGTGSASVTVHGASLGLVSYTGMVRTGQTGCEGTEWESASVTVHGASLGL